MLPTPPKPPVPSPDADVTRPRVRRLVVFTGKLS